jgi:hypothetical protein
VDGKGEGAEKGRERKRKERGREWKAAEMEEPMEGAPSEIYLIQTLTLSPNQILTTLKFRGM